VRERERERCHPLVIRWLLAAAISRYFGVDVSCFNASRSYVTQLDIKAIGLGCARAVTAVAVDARVATPQGLLCARTRQDSWEGAISLCTHAARTIESKKLIRCCAVSQRDDVHRRNGGKGTKAEGAIWCTELCSCSPSRARQPRRSRRGPQPGQFCLSSKGWFLVYKP
jgi:hypothetical protein